MATFPSLPLFTDAYLADTEHLSDAEHGRYLRLLMIMWRAPDCRLPNDDDWLARRLRRTVEQVRDEIRPIIREFCECTGNWISQKRLRREWEWCTEKSKKNSDSAKSRWTKNKCRSGRNASDSGSGNAPTPNPTPTEIHDDRDARARDALISPEAFALAEAVAKIAGYPDPKDWPPGWCGAPARAQMWLNDGWSTATILPACRGAMMRKRDGPPNSIQYFEKPIAAEMARQSAPLPEVTVLPAQTVEVRDVRKPETVVDAARRIQREYFGERPGRVRAGTGGSVVRLLPQG